MSSWYLTEPSGRCASTARNAFVMAPPAWPPATTSADVWSSRQPENIWTSPAENAGAEAALVEGDLQAELESLWLKVAVPRVES